jgi:hypothetical protein
LSRRAPDGVLTRIDQATISSWGYLLSAQTMTVLAHKVGEITLLNRSRVSRI